MSQNGCAENDPNGPVFDPVHGVVHHFYQIHLAAPPGHGPDYGHFVSKDFVTWAELPVAIWNGVDSTTGVATPYDNEAIYTGSAVVVDGAGPGGKGPGVVNIYPGLCNKNDWPGCTTGTLLAQAVPADYAGDELLVNWTRTAPRANSARNSTRLQFPQFVRRLLSATTRRRRGRTSRPDAVASGGCALSTRWSTGPPPTLTSSPASGTRSANRPTSASASARRSTRCPPRRRAPRTRTRRRRARARCRRRCTRRRAAATGGSSARTRRRRRRRSARSRERDGGVRARKHRRAILGAAQ